MTGSGLQLHVIGSRQMGGAERFYLRLVHAMAEQGHSVQVVCRPGSPIREHIADGVHSHLLGMRNGWDLLSVIGMRRFIKKAAPEVVQTYMGRATRLTRLPPHSGAVHVARLGGYYKIRGYYGHADAWVGNTGGLCDYLVQEGLPARQVYQIGNFVDLKPPTPPDTIAGFREKLGVSDDAMVVFALGRVISIKGFDMLLTAFGKLPSAVAGRPLFLVLAGDGPLRKGLQASIQGKEVAKRVIWAGWQPDPAPFFDMAELLVCPSRRETLGNVILEAWSHRLPVIATKTPGALELIRNGENGLLVPIDDVARLSSQMLELLDGPSSVRQEMAETGYTDVIRHHTKEHVIQKYLTMYDDVKLATGK